MMSARRTPCAAVMMLLGLASVGAGTAPVAPGDAALVRSRLAEADAAYARGDLASARTALHEALGAVADDSVQRLLYEAAQAREEGRSADFRRCLKSAVGLSDPAFWLILGFAAQALFTSRFLVQWITSERRGQSVIPMSFWYFSLSGSTLLLVYAIWRRDPVFILGQAFGCIVYVRNLMLIFRRHARERGTAAPSAG